LFLLLVIVCKYRVNYRNRRQHTTTKICAAPKMIAAKKIWRLHNARNTCHAI
jgi:hypothetical protein